MKNKKIYVCPSILSADFSAIKDELEKIKTADMIHCDIMDGMFVPNISFGPKMVADIRKRTALTLDVHLMIEKPQRYIKQFADAGADYITVHYEACGKDLNDTLLKIKALGKKCGAVINPQTPVNVLSECLHLCDMILIMSVNPGFGGQKFIEQALDKLAEAREMIDKSGREILLEIDGGINDRYAPLAVEKGADVLVAGSYIFSQKDIDGTIARLKNL